MKEIKTEIAFTCKYFFVIFFFDSNETFSIFLFWVFFLSKKFFFIFAFKNRVTGLYTDFLYSYFFKLKTFFFFFVFFFFFFRFFFIDKKMSFYWILTRYSVHVIFAFQQHTIEQQKCAKVRIY